MKTNRTRRIAQILISLVTLLASCDTHEMGEPGLLVPLTVDEDPSLPSISVNGTQLHAEAMGTPGDPMIVVIHGGPGGDYRGLLNCADLVADGFFVVFYDQRGSGLSKRHDASVYTVQIFIDDLDAVIRHYRVTDDQPVILLGHSWGAMLATAYVDQYPGRVTALVLAEPGGLTWKDTKAYIERMIALEPFDETSNDFVYLDQLITGDDHEILDYKASLRSAWEMDADNKVGLEGLTPFWRYGAVCNSAANRYAEKHGFDFRTNLQQFTTKVLFIYSERNQAYGRAHAERVSSAFPDVELYEIMGTGHEMIHWKWTTLYPVVRGYLNNYK